MLDLHLVQHYHPEQHVSDIGKEQLPFNTKTPPGEPEPGSAGAAIFPDWLESERKDKRHRQTQKDWSKCTLYRKNKTRNTRVISNSNCKYKHGEGEENEDMRSVRPPADLKQHN